MRLADQDARDAIQQSLAETLIVEAAAGTGKTTALVGRIVRLIASGVTELRQIVSVTFTEKAAGEMKLRLRAAVERARETARGEEAKRLERGLLQLEVARIGTIHSLCSDLLKERPVEAQIDPKFSVCSESSSKELFNRAFDAWFRDSLSDPGPGLSRLLRRAPSKESDRQYFALRSAGWDLSEHRDFTGTWRKCAFNREAGIDAVVAGMRALSGLAEEAFKSKNPPAQTFTKMGQAIDQIDRLEAIHPRDYDGLEAEFRGYLSGDGRWWSLDKTAWRGRYSRGLEGAEVDVRRGASTESLKALVAACEAELAPLLHEELQPVSRRYEALKRQAGVLDFVDLLQCTRDLLAGSSSVREELQGRFTHILVDEFQDTDPLQVAILMLLASDDPEVNDPGAVRPVPGKLFVAADPKQSIYRFRRADIAIYKAVNKQLMDCGARTLHLSVSFRSDPRIQEFVNGAFAPVMRGGAQADYVALQPYRSAVPGRPATIALGIPDPYNDWGYATKTKASASIPKAVGAWVDWLVHRSGWTVTDPQTLELVPVQPRHVCLLFRSFRGWNKAKTTGFVSALEQRGVPHVLVGGRSFHEREEVAAMRSALIAIERPEDELHVFATLRGPLFAVGDDALVAWRGEVGRVHPLRPEADLPAEGILAEVSGALRVLGELHRLRNRRPFAETVTRLLATTRSHAAFAIWNAGEQVLANVLRFGQLATEAEESGATSFRAFVEGLEVAAQQGADVGAATLEEGTEGVRMMTVHRSKGLEFPVVILCDPEQSKTFSRPTRWVDPVAGCWYQPIAGCTPIELQEASSAALERDAEEAERLLYVATTRARDVLVIPALGDVQLEGWAAPLQPSLYPPYERRLSPQPAPGCPPLGQDTVRARPGKAPGVDAGVRPGLHVAQSGAEIVWWGPAGLPEAARNPHGLRHQELLVDDTVSGSSARGRADHQSWQAARAAREQAATEGALEVRTATALARGRTLEDLPTELPKVEWTTDAKKIGRPGGIRFGSLVHGVLEVIPYEEDVSIEPFVAQQAAMFGAQESEQTAAVFAVRAAIAHPLLRRAAASVDCRREAPFVHRSGEVECLEGTIDLVFREDRDGVNHWVVVEFKTALGDDETARRYGIQLQIYVDAVRAATGASVEGTLLIV